MIEQTVDLTAKQIALEEESVGIGAERYWQSLREKQSRNEEHETGPGAFLIRSSFLAVVETIKEKLTPKEGAGRTAVAVGLLKGSDPEVLALIALRGCMASLSTAVLYTKAASEIGRHVRDEMAYSLFKKECPEVYADTQKYIEQHRYADQRTGVVRKMMRNNGVSLDWEDAKLIHIGTFLIDAVMVATGLFETRLESQGINKTPRVIAATQKLLDWVQDAHERKALLVPFRRPMVVPPADWQGVSGGGYLTDAGGRLELVKTRNGEYLNSLAQCDIGEVLEAVNTLQRVPWRVNDAVLSVAQQCFKEGIAIGGLVTADHTPLPALPAGWEGRPHELKKADPPLYKTWAVVAAQVHDENSRLGTKRISAAVKLDLADTFAQYPAIYFPYQLDFRGRVYPVCNHLQPQGDDLAKSLLCFAEGKPIGARGLWWLKVHIANCFGVDKVGFEERVAWADDNEQELLASGLDPMGSRLWMSASDPWQALAACIELSRVYLHGAGYRSSLPIPMDGSCNGLQNFSAMLRDPIGGKATNIVPQEKPADIYSEVARLVSEQVRMDAMAGNPHAMLVDGRVNRKIVKQPVMTLPYGATRKGMQGQIMEALKKNYPGLIPRSETFKVADYLATITYDRIGQVVVAARQAMDWLQAVAKVVSREKYPLRWTSPIGLPVLQSYWAFEEHQVRLHINGKSQKLTVLKEIDTIDTRKQAAGISPNLIHSFDASHMMRTALMAKDNGIEHLAMIHDSFGTHAADTDTLHACIRESFIEQYSGNVLQSFLDEIKEQVRISLIVTARFG